MTPLEPLVLGARTAPSRVVFGPHETNLGDGRAFSERHVAYYERRAAHGVGVIVTEEASVHASDWPYERCPAAWEAPAGWAAIAEACRPHGTLVVAALGHAGGQGSSAYSQAPLWAPSRVPETNSREVPKWMEEDEVEALVAGFATHARAAVAAGCDGVEVNAGQFSLLRQFLSGLTNHRGDRWADRPALARAVLAEVRAAVGPDAVVGLRLSCDELAPWAGIVPEAGAALAAELAGPVDYVTVVRGSIFSASATRPDGHVAPGFNRELVGAVRAAVRAEHGDRVAVVAQGSIVEWDQAASFLAEGDADAVEMTRALLADAQMVDKARRGHPERIRPCILCNQACQVRDARNPIVSCVVDPRTGHELDEPDLEHAGESRSASAVTVVGAGVAGLEAARVAALRGHRVVVRERSGATGGMLRVAAAGSGRERLAAFADWLEAECRRRGVEVVLDDEVDEVDGPVVVATGSRPAPPTFAATRAAVVRTAADVLAGGELPAGRVLVWDPVGGPVGVSVAETLAAAGREVVLATPDQIVGNELSRSGDLAPANARLQQAGVLLERRVVLRHVRKGSAEVEDRFRGALRSLPAAVVVDCGHRLPDDALFSRLVAGERVVARAGDAVAPRTVLEAVLEGRRAALALDGIGRLSDGVPMGDLRH